MTHVGIVSEPEAGHLNPALTIGRELRRRGHRCTVFGIADVEATVAASGLEFAPIGLDLFPPGTLAEQWLAPRHQQGVRNLVHTIRVHVRETEMLCRDVPDLVRRMDVDVLLVDQLQVCGRYLADTTGRPFATLCAGPGLTRTAGERFPPPFVPWGPSDERVRRLLNRVGFAGMQLVGAPRLRVTNRYARRDSVRTHCRVDDTSSPTVQLTQLVPELNFDYVPPPGSPFRYVGPIIDRSRPPVAFPWHRLDGRPLVYASLGTLQSRADRVFEAIATACSRLDVQLVLVAPPRQQPGDPIVVSSAPQLELLERATLCITHCGMNTTMECAAFGVPVVGIPIVYDQPAVAARIAHAGMGEILKLKELGRLEKAIRAVLDEPRFRQRAAAIAAACATYGGPAAAADAVSGLAAPAERLDGQDEAEHDPAR